MPRVKLEEDKVIGQRLRSYRAAAGLSQEQMGDMVGVSFQQIQKRESGANRVSCGTLLKYSRVLGVPIIKLIDPDSEDTSDISGKRGTIEIARRLDRMPDAQRQVVLKLVNELERANEAAKPA